MSRRLQALWLITRTAFQADRRGAVRALVLTILDGVMRAGFALWLKLITDGVVHRDLRGVIAGAVAFGTSMCVLGYVSLARVTILTRLSERTAFLVDQRVVELSASIPTLEHFERSDFLDEMAMLRTMRGYVATAVWALAGNALTLITLASTVVLLARIHPLMVLLPVFAVPAIFASARATEMRQDAMRTTADRSRAAQALLTLATAPGPGKELRVFALQDELTRRHRALSEDMIASIQRATVRGGLLTALAHACFALGFAAALVLVVVLAVNAPHTATPGDAVLVITLAGQINQDVGQAAATVTSLMLALDTMRRYLWLVDYARTATATRLGAPPPPQTMRSGIRFEAVDFRYPGTDTTVLRGIDLDIPAGTTLAIVGENGAGKTTLVKLLCRLYQPSAGRITVDGVDLADFDVAAWRQRISSGFQDFAQLQLVARETVGVGELSRIEDPAAVLAALDRAHAGDVLPALPKHLETQLGTSFDGGVDLSLGQWQKLALGRAMMREAPLLFLLDEPTASLDAQTEHALFDRYAAAARHTAATTGGITLLVSHRFSTIRMADLIVVVDGGTITEAGAHHDLVRAGGLYASLYELQARAYR